MLRKYLIVPILLFAAMGAGAAPAVNYQERAEEALEAYDISEARSVLENWRTRLSRQRRPSQEQLNSLEELTSRLNRLSTMMSRVEALEIVDSITVPKEGFFTAYRLSPESGRILPPDILSRAGLEVTADSMSTVFMPQNRRELLWAQHDTAGVSTLWGAGFLDDGSIDGAAPLDDVLAGGAPAAYPFLMPDGMTLYFASKAEDGLGGYDIFMSRRETDGSYMQPQNLGLPYNSPYDDYMLAVDETNGLGWFATDRNHIPDSLTVYVFLSAPVRVNVDAQDENLAAKARLSHIALNQKEGVNYRALMADKTLHADTNSVRTDIFDLDLGNGRVVHTLDELPAGRPRQAMLEYLGVEDEIARENRALQAMRGRYHAGETNLEQNILDAEHHVEALRRNAMRLRNAVVSAVRQ